MNYTQQQLDTFKTAIDEAQHIMVMQAERIDADSLGSSLGLEAALTKLGKQVTLFAYDEVPNYLRHMPGWDRVTSNIPNNYDIAILVDSSTINQLERTWADHKGTITKRPLFCLDHHASTTGQLEGENIILMVDDEAGASGQQVTELAQHFGWEIDAEGAYALASAIKADTVNLATKKVSSDTFAAMGHLVECGADLEQLRYNIEQSSSITPADLPLKATGLQRVQFFKDEQIAITYFTQEEYESLGEDQLVIERMKQDLRMIKGVEVSVTITERKGYSNASMRANIDVARKTAEHFGGGGHDRAASCRFFEADHKQVIEQIVPKLSELIDEQNAKAV